MSEKLTAEELADMRCRRRPDAQLDRLLSEHAELMATVERVRKVPRDEGDYIKLSDLLEALEPSSAA